MFRESTEGPGGLAKLSFRLMSGPLYRRRPKLFFFHPIHKLGLFFPMQLTSFLTHLGGWPVSSAGLPKIATSWL